MCAIFGKSWSGNPESRRAHHFVKIRGCRKLHPSSLTSKMHDRHCVLGNGSKSERRPRRWCHSRHQTSTIAHTLIPKAIFFKIVVFLFWFGDRVSRDFSVRLEEDRQLLSSMLLHDGETEADSLADLRGHREERAVLTGKLFGSRDTVNQRYWVTDSAVFFSASFSWQMAIDL